MTDKVYGAQCNITFDLNFVDLVDSLDMTVEQISKAWNDGELSALIDNKLSLAEVIGLSQDPEAYGGLEVGSGKIPW